MTTPGVSLDDVHAMTEFGLWTGLVALTVMDAATTLVALALGLPELNPLISGLIHRVGPVAVVAVKAVYLVAAFAVWRSIEGTARLYALAAATCLSALVVANNLVWLVAVGGDIA